MMVCRDIHKVKAQCKKATSVGHIPTSWETTSRWCESKYLLTIACVVRHASIARSATFNHVDSFASQKYINGIDAVGPSGDDDHSPSTVSTSNKHHTYVRWGAIDQQGAFDRTWTHKCLLALKVMNESLVWPCRCRRYCHRRDISVNQCCSLIYQYLCNTNVSKCSVILWFSLFLEVFLTCQESRYDFSVTF